jgi:hypothetical protein
MFAENEDDHLLFELNDINDLELLENNYSKLLCSFMQQYLHGSNGSLPAFTAALTLDLVNRITTV